MTLSLKDQLLGLGFAEPLKKAPAVAKPAAHGKNTLHKGNPKQHRSAHPTKAPTPTKTQAEMDLAKAFALRMQHDKRERDATEKAKQAAALQKKIAKAQVAELLQGAILNADTADIARHFSYGEKIKRIYVTNEQLIELNAGKLGVVQFNGRFCLVSQSVALAVRAQLPALLALYCDGTEQPLPQGYDDPKFQVPDDLIW